MSIGWEVWRVVQTTSHTPLRISASLLSPFHSTPSLHHPLHLTPPSSLQTYTSINVPSPPLSLPKKNKNKPRHFFILAFFDGLVGSERRERRKKMDGLKVMKVSLERVSPYHSSLWNTQKPTNHARILTPTFSSSTH